MLNGGYQRILASVIYAISIWFSGCTARLEVTFGPSMNGGASSQTSVASTTPLPHQNISCTLKSLGGSCDHVVNDLSTSNGPNLVTKKISGSSYQSGQRVCIKGGNYPYAYLKIENVSGSEGSPIEFINCGGQVVVGNDIDANADGAIDASRGIDFYNAKYVKLSGTGSLNHRYGFKIAGTQSGVGGGLVFSSLSSDMEVEYVEIAKAGFAGVMAKTDPGCSDTDPNSFRGGFVQRNSIFHDNYIHDVGGEGFYVGYSFYYGNTGVNGCIGTPVYSHPVVGTKIYNNRLERTGCEAIQVGCGPNTEVFNNYIYGYGVSPFANYQNNGIQIGGGTSGKFYNNYIINPDPNFPVSSGIMIISYQDTLVYGNTIVNPGGGMYIHKDVTKSISGQFEPYKLQIVNNTIVNPIGASGVSDGKGIDSFNANAEIEIINNLIVLGDKQVFNSITDAWTPTDYLLRNAVYDKTNDNQHAGPQTQGYTSANILQVGNSKHLKSELNSIFVNAAGFDFHLKPSSGAINAGVNLTPYAVPLLPAMSIDANQSVVIPETRVSKGSLDVGAWETQ